MDWQAKLEMLQDYLTTKSNAEYYELVDEIQIFRKGKAHQKGTAKLEMSYDKSSHTGKVMKHVFAPMLVDMGARRQLNVEPQGDIERQLQAWMDARR